MKGADCKRSLISFFLFPLRLTVPASCLANPSCHLCHNEMQKVASLKNTVPVVVCWQRELLLISISSLHYDDGFAANNGLIFVPITAHSASGLLAERGLLLILAPHWAITLAGGYIYCPGVFLIAPFTFILASGHFGRVHLLLLRCNHYWQKYNYCGT